MNWQNLPFRLEGFRHLEPDWDGWNTGPIRDDVIDFASKILSKFENSGNWDIEWIIPTSEGTVLVFLVNFNSGVFMKIEIEDEDVGIAQWKNNQRTYHDADLISIEEYI